MEPSVWGLVTYYNNRLYTQPWCREVIEKSYWVPEIFPSKILPLKLSPSKSLHRNSPVFPLNLTLVMKVCEFWPCSLLWNEMLCATCLAAVPSFFVVQYRAVMSWAMRTELMLNWMHSCNVAIWEIWAKATYNLRWRVDEMPFWLRET